MNLIHMNKDLFLIFLSVTLMMFVAGSSCTGQKKTTIVADPALAGASTDLIAYLSRTYPDEKFILSDKKSEGTKNIILEITDTETLENDEACRIFSDGDQLFIQGETPRAVFHGVYGLLKELGWRFYLSFEVPPENPGPLDFSDVKLENAPLKARRIIFNWHNFLSGCTGWDYEQWEQWIDNASKTGFNTIMVHAYGNNPMYSFSMNGLEKETGYLTTTLKGRDWGAEHVNDVRRVTGGDIFTVYEFGSKAAKVPENERNKAATALMKKVFKHAAGKSMGVCFALDVDTWMANPQNIINSLPDEALLEIGGYNIVNPENPEGKKYYEAQLKKLLADYPEITMIAAWMRHPQKKPGQGSIWLKYDSNTLPAAWRKEYFEILSRHPELDDERPYPGLFAISKIIKTYHEMLMEIRPGIELVLGSWRLDYPKQADPFMPDYCGFIPLDYERVFDDPEVLEKLSAVGENRNLYPVVWAHHDDHRYIGRPYRPYRDFNDLLNKAHAAGYGIIHWMTHPLDLYFNCTENQVWKNPENESPERASRDFANALLKSDDENLVAYYDDWFSNAPMFGRETTDFFIRADKDYQLDGYKSSLEVVEKAEKRLEILEKVDPDALNAQGIKEYNYQLGMEKFIISFFKNHHNIHRAYVLLEEGERAKSMPFIKKLNPEETIDLYSLAVAEHGPTRGEEGVLVSLNLRWLPDYIDIRQRAGLEPVRINFQPTSHDSLAQAPGNFTFFIDEDKNMWIAFGEKELSVNEATNGTLPLQKVIDGWVEISSETTIQVKTIRNFSLPATTLKITLIPAPESAGGNIGFYDDNQLISSMELKEFNRPYVEEIKIKGDLSVKIDPSDKMVRLAGLVVE